MKAIWMKQGQNDSDEVTILVKYLPNAHPLEQVN